MTTSFVAINYIELYNMVKEKKERKPNRLKDYDYSQNGAYFITICTKDRKPILSKITPMPQIIVGATIGRPCELHLSQIGVIVENGIKGMEQHYENVYVDNYVIMPNHIHLLLRIDNDNGRPMVAPTIAHIINQFKGYVTKQVGKPVWQKLYYDHIIRDDIDYMTKYQYIDENPTKWAEDKYYL